MYKNNVSNSIIMYIEKQGPISWYCNIRKDNIIELKVASTFVVHTYDTISVGFFFPVFLT